MKTPRDIAIEQLIAYNNKDLNAFCALFSPDAILTDLPSGQVVADGMEEIINMYRDRFSTPNLSCRVHATNDIGDFAIDRETIEGLSDGPMDVVAMYEVKNELIQRVFFIRQ